MKCFRDNKFIVSCSARTGSTMLVHLLRSNPEIICHGEVFEANGVGHLVGHYARLRRKDSSMERRLFAYRREHPEAFLYDIVFDLQGAGRNVVGFKFKTDEAFDPAFADIAVALRRDTAIKVIQLRRKNLLDQYISHQVVLHQTGITMIRDEDIPEINAFRIDVEHALHYVTDVVQREERSISDFSGHRNMMVDYEDLAAGDVAIRERLQAFLEVRPVALSTPTRKIIRDNYALVENLDEILAEMNGKGLADRCYVDNQSAAD